MSAASTTYSDGVILTLLLAGAMLALVVYAIFERSQGAERRWVRQRRAKKLQRADAARRRELEAALPQAVAHLGEKKSS